LNVKKKPLISVVMPTYNHARYLGRAIESVIEQNFTNWEIIVVDNYSSDNTQEVVKSFTDPRIIYLRIHNDGVIAASRNLGVDQAKGEWIAFIDSDDWWTKDKLQSCYEYMNDKTDLIYHDLEIVANKPVGFRRKLLKSWQLNTPVYLDLLMRGNPIANSSVVVRKKLLKKIGGINECVEMISVEDYNTWLRIASLTEKFLYISRSLGYYFIHSNNSSQKDLSIPCRYATEEFFHRLSERQKIKIEANFRFISARFNYLNGNFKKAKDDLWFVIRNDRSERILKCILMIVSIQAFKVFRAK